MAERDRAGGEPAPEAEPGPEGGQARDLPGAEPRRMAMGRGYGRDFGGGGLNQGFDGSHGEGYGGSVAPSDYREGFGGDDRTWMDQAAEGRSEGPHRGKGPRAWSRSDERIREAVCERLLHDRLLDARDVEVSVQDGLVTLRGDVPGASDAAHAEMLAGQASGVTGVVNQLAYHPGRRQVDRPEVDEEPQGQRTPWGKWVPPFTP